MRLKVDPEFYTRLWTGARDTRLSDLHGTYHVEIATGMGLNKKNWRKFIHNPPTHDDKRLSDQEGIYTLTGYNLKGDGENRFGDFEVCPYHIVVSGHTILAIKLDYVDYYHSNEDVIIMITPGLFLGRRFYKGKFRGWFWMISEGFIGTVKCTNT